MLVRAAPMLHRTLVASWLADAQVWLVERHDEVLCRAEYAGIGALLPTDHAILLLATNVARDAMQRHSHMTTRLLVPALARRRGEGRLAFVGERVGLAVQAAATQRRA